MIKHLILVSSLISSCIFAADNRLDNISELKLLIGDIEVAGSSNGRLVFAEFPGFIILRDTIIEITNNPSNNIDKKTPLFTMEISLSDSTSTSLTVEFGQTWMKIDDKEYVINSHQSKKIFKVLSFRLSKNQIKKLFAMSQSSIQVK
tara:strand:+ start:161 stop:601 length:441 start_codon:yes stop_codon:yes gene_type:complete